MDSHFPATREDLYHVQMDIKHVQSVQSNQGERIARIEQRQRDDAALKSVWGRESPFPSVLSGTPQQGKLSSSFTRQSIANISLLGPIQHLPSDEFEDFDDEQGHSLLGGLHLDADEGPVRRGASRANSVRFADPALQGEHWGHASRNSGDFGPIRPGSAFGGHPMAERSMSHKSDGRHSSAGHSIHSVPSGRNSSMGLDTNFIIGDQDEDSPLDVPAPPPGLFILGSVPSIIRCWLTHDFSHNALLYAVICTGAQRSTLDYSLVKELGLVDQVQKQPTGRSSIRLPVHLPEAIVTQPCSRSNSPAPQLPALTVDFELVGINQRSASDRKGTMRVFLGSDTLRAHSADVLLSQNVLTLYGDDRNKLSVPFVRPEDESVFKNLCTSSISPEKNELKATAPAFTPTESKIMIGPVPVRSSSDSGGEVEMAKATSPVSTSISTAAEEQPLSPGAASTGSPVESNKSSQKSPTNVLKAPPGFPIPTLNGNLSESGKHHEQSNTSVENPDGTISSDASRRESSVGIWGSWRQGATSGGSDNGESTSGYQRPARGGGRPGIKVLKHSKSTSTTPTLAPARSSSGARTGAAYEPAPVSTRRKSTITGAENTPPSQIPARWDTKKEEPKPKMIPTISRSSNPIGTASAFAWLGASKPKASATVE